MTDNSIIVVAPRPLSRNLNDETVILDLNAGMYFSLKGVGTRVWELIQQRRTVKEIRDLLVQEYEVSLEECDRDLHGLVDDLAARGLIEVRSSR